MESRYFNHAMTMLAASQFSRLLKAWWQLAGKETRATPFYLPNLRAMLRSTGFNKLS